MSDPGTKPQQQQAIAIELVTAQGPLRAMLPIPPKPMRLPELAFNFMAMSSKLTDMAVADEERAGREISCRKGCGACCRQVVPLSPPEAWMIADLIAGMNEGARSAARAAFASVAEALDRAGLKASLCGRIEHLDRPQGPLACLLPARPRLPLPEQ
jgi:hypothetical protein